MVFAGDFNRDFQANLVGILREGIENRRGAMMRLPYGIRLR